MSSAESPHAESPRAEDPRGGEDLSSLRGARTVTSLDDSDERFNTRSGVFYPNGFALLAFPDRPRLRKAVEICVAAGLPESDVTVLTPAQVKTLAGDSREDAGMLARIVAAELKQMTVLEQLADTGHHFLLIRSTDEARPTLDRIGVAAGASKGLLFHTLAIEELPVDKETIPGDSPFGVNEVIRTQDSDADLGR